MQLAAAAEKLRPSDSEVSNLNFPAQGTDPGSHCGNLTAAAATAR